MATTTPAPSIPKKRDYPVGIALLLIHIGALGVFLPMFFSWSAVAVAVVFYILTGGGITLAYHRLLTHRSLVVPKPVEYALTIVGVLALQGGPIEWVAQHRAHHAHTDKDGDPHNSHRGMPWAHIEWLFRTNQDRVAPEDRARWAPDLVKDPGMRFIEKYNVLMTVALAVVFLLVGGWSWVIWGIFARLVFTYHCTWLVNSASHAVGYQTYRTGDRSTNSWWVALLTFGEGWHNNHHAFPFSARHGLRWFEFDLTWLTIKAMAWLKLASNVKLPSHDMMERLKVNSNSTRNAA
ncbi:MAG: fatty acid desaturase [Candidatus Eremiobacteraeota bacterium]|nr:fatty acid desaturase [Candidatus Eremiobacteraeota bacterium]